MVAGRLMGEIVYLLICVIVELKEALNYLNSIETPTRKPHLITHHFTVITPSVQ